VDDVGVRAGRGIGCAEPRLAGPVLLEDVDGNLDVYGAGPPPAKPLNASLTADAASSALSTRRLHATS
jgi:hypothetical protein